MKTQKQIIGDLGEGITCNYLQDKGFKIIDRNYLKPWGEIDIIAEKPKTMFGQGKEIIHFVEVKTVSRNLFDFELGKQQDVIRETQNMAKNGKKDVIRETKKGEDSVIRETIMYGNRNNNQENEQYQAEDNLHLWKLKRLSRVIQTYLIENNINEEKKWQFDVAIVYLDTKNKLARVKYLEDVVL